MRGDDRPPPPRGWPDGFGSGEHERRALLTIASLRSIDRIQLRRLAWQEGTARGALARIREGRLGSEADRARARLTDPAAVAAGVEACGARFVSPADVEFPPALLDLPDVPGWLFAIGRELDPAFVHVAVVGSRSASALGSDVSFDIGRRLAGVGACVVSGAARGIDIASHRGALAAGGRTVAVLGSGIDVWYPKGSAETIGVIASEGTIVSEYLPGTPAEPHRFPERNRLIVGLARAVVVVEGRERSGSMISVRHALDSGREVFAVPGPVTSQLSAVPLRLIREGARMIRGADDLLEDLGFDPSSLPAGALSELPADERKVLAAVEGKALPDAVARSVGLPFGEVVGLLMQLEIRGLVRNIGGRFEITIAGSSRRKEPVA